MVHSLGISQAGSRLEQQLALMHWSRLLQVAAARASSLEAHAEENPA
jgi:hypothetical protein